MTKSYFTLPIMISLVIFSVAVSAAGKATDPCSLLTLAEIQEALAKPVKAGVLKTHASPAAGSDCTFVVGDLGSFNILLKPMYAGETPERIKAQFAKMKMNPIDLPNVGDASFFTSPGFNMVQLHTIKGGKYILFTLLISGAKEADVRPMAEKLMRLAVTRIN